MLKVEVRSSNLDLSINAGIHAMHTHLADLPICSDKFMNNNSHISTWISNGKILETLIIAQGLGKTHFVNSETLSDESLLKNIVGRSISQETLRQRLNVIATEHDFYNVLDFSVSTLLSRVQVPTIDVNGTTMTTLDIDVTPFLNPDVKKEGISKTYKKIDGYAPIMAYYGDFAVSFDLREGKQHSEKDAPEFLGRCCAILRNANIDLNHVLLRVDSGHDASEFILKCEENSLNYLIARNFRSSEKTKRVIQYALNNVEQKIEVDEKDGKKTTYIKYRYIDRSEKPANAPNSRAYAVYEIRKRVHKKEESAQYSLMLESAENVKIVEDTIAPYEVSSWWTNLEMSNEFVNNYKESHNLDKNAPLDESGQLDCEKEFVGHVVQLYHDHATSEQLHSEVKTDLNMELLPSSHFATNRAYLALNAIAFNVQRTIGVRAHAVDPSFQHHKTVKTHRIRLATVIERLCRIPCQIVRHARSLILYVGKLHYKTFMACCRQ